MLAQFSWSTSDTNIVTVDADGLVTASGNGMATVTVRSGSVSASATVTVRQSVSRIELLPETVTLTGIGQTAQLKATALDANGHPVAVDIDFTSSDSMLASVDGTGQVTAQADGAATITVTVRGLGRAVSETAAITVQVSPPPGKPLTVTGDPNVRDPRTGHTLLHVAAMANAPRLIAALLAAGADLEARDKEGLTPLHAAAAGNGPAAIAALLEAGADLHARNNFRQTPLQYAVSLVSTGSYFRGRLVLNRYVPAAVAALLDAGAEPNDVNEFLFGATPLRSWTAGEGNSAILAALLEAGATLDVRDDNGATLLHLAAERDTPANIAALLKAGMELEARDDGGRTPLHAAAASTVSGRALASAAAMAVLLQAGADPTSRDDSGRTALELAPAPSTALIEALLDAQAGRNVDDPGASDALGYTALHAAARANSPKLIAALIEAGADIDARDNYGHTPLLLAAGARPRRGRNVPPPTYSEAAILALAAAGADLAAHGDNGLNPLQQALSGAADRRNSLALAAIAALAHATADRGGSAPRDFMALLALAAQNPAAIGERVQAGTDPNARDELGRTVLHWVVEWEDSAALAAISALKEAGADLNARDRNDWIPLPLAAFHQRSSIVAALLNAGADPNARDTRGGRTALYWAAYFGIEIMVSALTAAGADLEVRDAAYGRTPLQWATERGKLAAIAALATAGANLEARDGDGRTALQLAAVRNSPLIAGDGPATVAALVEAGADHEVVDADGNTLLHAAALAGQLSTTVFLRAWGANWTSVPDADQPDLNARIVAVELFQGPMVWHWEPDESDDAASGSDMSEGRFADHAKTLLRRAATIAVRIGSESPDPMPELSVRLIDIDERAWAVQADLVQDPLIVGLPGNSDSGLWETEYVFELPADWVDSGHRAVFSIDPYNRLNETDEDDNSATLTMDGYAVPVFDVTFVPVFFSGTSPVVDADTHMAVIYDLLPIGEYRARAGDPLDLSGRNLGVSNVDLSKQTALDELLHRWNAEASESEHYYGLLIPDGATIGFGGLAYRSANVAVSGIISEQCQVERVFCGAGTHAHEIGHNFSLPHAPGNCDESQPIDVDFPYPDAGIGPRRGWVASRDNFVTPGDDYRHFDVMGYCNPRFVSDYNYNKMVEYRLGSSPSPPDASARLGPSLQIGAIASDTTSAVTLQAPTVAHVPPAGAASPTEVSGSAHAVTGVVDEIGASLAVTGTVDEYGLWSVFGIDVSTQPPRSPAGGGQYFFTLLDASQQEIHREPMRVLAPAHGATGRAWTVRTPVPERAPAFVAILDAQGTPLFIWPIDVPPIVDE